MAIGGALTLVHTHQAYCRAQALSQEPIDAQSYMRITHEDYRKPPWLDSTARSVKWPDPSDAVDTAESPGRFRFPFPANPVVVSSRPKDPGPDPRKLAINAKAYTLTLMEAKLQQAGTGACRRDGARSSAPGRLRLAPGWLAAKGGSLAHSALTNGLRPA